MHIELIAPPLVEPITVEAAFVELRLGAPGDDFQSHPDYAAVRAKMRAAAVVCENETHRAFVQQTLRVVGAPDDLAAFRGPAGAWRPLESRGFALHRPPVQEIVAVSYLDADSEVQVIDPADYYVVAGDTPRLFFASGVSLPTTAQRPDALRIDYVAGYPPGEPDEDYDPDLPPQHLAANVPAPIAQAVLLTMRLLFENLDPSDREATERTRDALLWPYKLLSV